MKSLKLIIAVMLFCFSQLSFAALVAGPNATQAEVTALANAEQALTQAPVKTQALIDALVQAAANAGVPVNSLVIAMYQIGVQPTAITTGISNNINAGVSGTNTSCAPNCTSADLQNSNASYSNVNNIATDSVNAAFSNLGVTAGVAGSGIGFAKAGAGANAVGTQPSAVSAA